MANPDRCPTCGKPLGETLSDQILVLLAQYSASGAPVTFSKIRDTTGRSNQGVANALNRLAARGAIERTDVLGVKGWRLTRHELKRQSEDEVVDVAEYLTLAPVNYAASTLEGWVDWRRARRFVQAEAHRLTGLDYTEPDVDKFIRLAIRRGLLREGVDEQDGRLFAVEGESSRGEEPVVDEAPDHRASGSEARG